MPTYDYKCILCGASYEFCSPVETRDEPIYCNCGWAAERVFSPNRNVFIPERFGLSRTWHMSDTGPSSDGMVGNNSQVHAPKRDTFQQAFDKNWDKMGRA